MKGFRLRALLVLAALLACTGPTSAKKPAAAGHTAQESEPAAAQPAASECSTAPKDADAAALFRAGEAAQGREDMAEAVACFRAASAKDPADGVKAFYVGASLARAGDTDGAIAAFRAASKVAPRMPEIYANLGTALEAKGKYEEAARSFEKAVELASPPRPETRASLTGVHNNYGVMLLRLGKAARAAAQFRKALAVDGRNELTHYNLALALTKTGDVEGATAAAREAHRLDPENPDFAAQLGTLVERGGDEAGAGALYEAALRAAPAHFVALSNYGLLKRRRGETDAALAMLRKALAVAPADKQGASSAYYNFGLACRTAGRLAEALEALGRAAELDEENWEAAAELGAAQKEAGRPAEAARSLQRAIKLNPNSPEAHNNLANALVDLGRGARAVAHYRAALSQRPNFPEAHNNLGGVFLSEHRVEEAAEQFAAALEDDPAFHDALGDLFQARLHMCDWREKDAVFARLRDALEAQLNASALPSVRPLHAAAYPLPAATIRKVADAYVKRAAGELPKPPAGHAVPPARSGPPAAWGFLSADFGDHPVGHLVAGLFGTLRGIAGAPPKLVAYSLASANAKDSSGVRDRIAEDAHAMFDVSGLTAEETVEQMKDDEIDVLFDLAGHTAGNRLPSLLLRPAPLAVSFLGYPATLGASGRLRPADLFAADRVAAAPSLAGAFAEKLLLLPGSYQANDHRRCCGDVPPAAALAFRDRARLRYDYGLPFRPPPFVLAAFSTAHKVDPVALGLWAAVMRRAPGAVLWLLAAPPASAPRLQAELFAHGLAESRLVLAGVVPKAAHLRRLAAADLLLDSLAYNAHSTASDALWAGVPALTVPHEAFPARVGASLAAAALPPAAAAALTAPSLKAYEDRAVALARGLPAAGFDAAQLQRALAEGRNASALFDARAYAASLNTAVRMAWDALAAGLPTHHVAPSALRPPRPAPA
eukprot:tig00001030_g6458.t1